MGSYITHPPPPTIEAYFDLVYSLSNIGMWQSFVNYLSFWYYAQVIIRFMSQMSALCEPGFQFVTPTLSVFTSSV
jgi:hypothetical protein